jgi:hypothetical protein
MEPQSLDFHAEVTVTVGVVALKSHINPERSNCIMAFHQGVHTREFTPHLEGAANQLHNSL